jgi:hypothetical protein
MSERAIPLFRASFGCAPRENALPHVGGLQAMLRGL